MERNSDVEKISKTKGKSAKFSEVALLLFNVILLPLEIKQ